MIDVRCHWLLPALAVLALIVPLAGCVGSATVARTHHYTLRPTVTKPDTGQRHTPANAQTNPQANVNGPILRLEEIRAPVWLNSTRMYYRLGYRTGAQLASYTMSQWVAPPPVLLAEVLQGALADMTRWKAVVGPAVTANADVTLRVTLNGFRQVFSSRTQSSGVIDITATLLGDKLIAQRRFHVSMPAPTPDASGGVKALDHASNEVARRIREWIAATQREHDTATPG